MLVLNIPTNNKADFFKILDFLVELRINILVVGVRMSNEDMISFYSLNFLTTLNFQGSRFDLKSTIHKLRVDLACSNLNVCYTCSNI
jgi:hypothetical protein